MVEVTGQMNRLGRREREAGKRHRRGSVWCSNWPAGSEPLKLGHKHSLRALRIPVADIEKPRGGRT